MTDRSNATQELHQTSKTIATKKLIVQEYKNRLKDSIKSINDNFGCVLSASKINCDDATNRSNSSGKLGEYYAIRNEAIARAALLVKSTNELKILTNEIREFLTLRDFNFISNSISKAEEDFKKQLEQYESDYSAIRMSISAMASEIDRELMENSLFSDTIGEYVPLLSLTFSFLLKSLLEMGESSNISDLWREFNHIKLSAQKKSLKKPNFQELIAQYRRLADSLEESEQFDQSALCHQEIASLCAGVVNRFMERRHLLKAAKLYYSAQLSIQRTNSACSAKYGKLMEQCYLEVIQGLLNSSEISSNFFIIVGLTHFELALQMHSLKEPFKAFIYLKRANRFVQGDLPIQIQIVENLCDLVLTIGKEHSEEVLSEVDSIWVSLPKMEGMRERLLSLEARLILLHLKQGKSEICLAVASLKVPLSKHFLSTYDGNWRDSARVSVATEREFQLFSQFISAVKNDNFVKASQMHAIEMAKLLDSKGNESCAELIDLLNFNQAENSEIDAILESSEFSELEKRNKLFDMLNNFSRFANTQCFENL